MKLTNVEKSILRILYDRGFRYLARDSIGLAAYAKKPYRQRSKYICGEMSDWMFNLSDNKHIFWMLNPDDFPVVDCKDVSPYMITCDGKLKVSKPTKKAVNV